VQSTMLVDQGLVLEVVSHFGRFDDVYKHLGE
jgi:hypothetical protein